MFKRILVPVDGSETSNKALATALQLAREGNGSVRLVHSFDELVYLTGFEYSSNILDVAREYAQKVLNDGLAGAKAAQPLDQMSGGALDIGARDHLASFAVAYQFVTDPSGRRRWGASQNSKPCRARRASFTSTPRPGASLTG